MNDPACTVDVATAAERPLVRRFFERAAHTPDAPAFAVYPAGATHATGHVSWGAWGAQVRACAARLLREDIAPGDRVAVLAGNHLMWPVLDVALQAVRAVGVGIFPGSNSAQIDALIADSGARLLFTDDRAQAQRLRDAGTKPPGLDLIVVDDSDAAVVATRDVSVIESWTRWCADGAAALSHDAWLADALDARLAAVSPDDLFAIVYTSGSTGEPKGACLSHRYLAASATSIVDALGVGADDRSMSYLPYSHAAERVFGQGVRMLVGGGAALVERPADLFTVAADYRPTVLPGLPRVFERLDEAITQAVAGGEDARAAFVARTGGMVRRATSGGATMPEGVASGLAALGMPVLGAYGQTEHLCIAMNRPAAPRFDTVGQPMAGTTVRCADDGELLVARNALTFSGYWNRPSDTRAAFTDDGQWLRTGDLATQDADGALRITGRVKELIALSTGRKIAPLAIEGALTATPYIAQATVHGEGRKFAVALLVPRRRALEAWAADAGVDAHWPALVAQPGVRALLQQSIDAVNATLARTDRVHAFAVLPDEFTLENGLLTPTLKVVRRAVEARYHTQLESLFAATREPP